MGIYFDTIPFKALSKRPYFSFRGKQPAIDSLMLGNPTSCEDHLNRPNHLDRSAILEFGPPSPFFMAREVKFTLSFCIAVDFCWCFLKVFVAFHSENINFMHCNAQGGLIPVFRITKILQILLWVIRFWSQTKKRGGNQENGNRTVASWATCYTVACEGQSYVSPRIYGVGRSRSLRQEGTEPPCHPCGEKKHTPKQKIPEI